uniref:Cytochrome C oxidase assembly protein COX19 n=1 Tax=Mycena chlorophos TaxID=658473 RepID=A0ABQ0L8N7_MYCCL|nr:cytochrome C oxidase assembly protein COX19 [Mycena chlorophos]
MSRVLPAGATNSVLLDSLTSQYDPKAELEHWERLVFSFDMDPNPNDPNDSLHPNKNSGGQSAEEIQTAALLTQLASTSDLFQLDTSYGGSRQSLYHPPPHSSQQYISPMSLGPPQGYDPRLAHPVYPGAPQIQPYNSQAVAELARRTRHSAQPPAPPALPQAGPSTSGGGAADDDVDADYEDKRRRNTQASARFRIKKKMRSLELERSVSDLTGRAEELEREAADLRRENGWLKEIVMLRGGGHLAGIDLSGGMGQHQRSQGRQREESESEPPSVNVGFKPSPPERGAFPLDHDGECKEQMKLYMSCLRSNANKSSPCRPLSKDYLDCRMNKGLMERDEWANLGFQQQRTDPPTDPDPPPKPPSSSPT